MARGVLDDSGHRLLAGAQRRVGDDRVEVPPAEGLGGRAGDDLDPVQSQRLGVGRGQLRRALHASELSLSAIAAGAGITPLLLDEFLTGERTLRSDVIDRLANVLGCQLSQAR